MKVERHCTEYKCDDCKKDGITKYGKNSVLKTKGTWFELSTQGGGLPFEFCSIECVFAKLKSISFNNQTVITIKQVHIEDNC